MKLFPSLFRSIAFLLAASSTSIALAQDPSIDNLLKKLPPPEKLIKPSIERALKQEDPALRDPIIGQIVNAATAGNVQRTLELSRKFVENHPQSPAAHNFQGVLYALVQKYSEAAAEFRKAIAIQASFAAAHFNLGTVEYLLGHFAGAMSHYQQAVHFEPEEHVPGWLSLSLCADKLGRKQESLTYAKRAAAEGPAFAAVWIQLARAENALGHSTETLNAMKRAAEVNPDSGPLLAAIGYGYINLNRVPEAVAPLQRAVRFAPNDYLVHSQLGFCLQATGRVDAGISHLRKGASLRPNYGPVWEHLGLAYQKKGLHADAVKAFEKASKLMPESRLPWQHLADEYAAAGRAADAQRAKAHAQQLPSKKKTPKH